MRPDRIAPLTWLLMAAAGWAVLGAALAAAGMGSRVPMTDTSDVAAQPLPQPAGDAQLPPPVPYTALATRPPFAQDRRPHPFSLPGNGGDDARANAAAFDYVLTSVMIAPRFRMAIIEPSQGGDSIRVREGESAAGLGGWRLVELRPRAAVFDGPGGRRELEMRLWAGGDASAADASAVAPPPLPDGSTQGASAAAADAASEAAASEAAANGPASAPAPTQVTQQMQAIRRRIEARRAQLRREAAQQPGAPARNP